MTTTCSIPVGARYKIGNINQLAIADAMLNYAGILLVLTAENRSMGEFCHTRFTTAKTVVEQTSGKVEVHFHGVSIIRGEFQNEDINVKGTLIPNSQGGFFGHLEVVDADKVIPL